MLTSGRAVTGLALAYAAFGLAACSTHPDQTAGGLPAPGPTPGAVTQTGKTYNLDDDTTVLQTIDKCEVDYIKAHPGNPGVYDPIFDSEQTCAKPYVGDTFSWRQPIADTQGVKLADGPTSELTFGFVIPNDAFQIKAICPVSMTSCTELGAGATTSVTAKMTVIDIESVRGMPSFVVQSITPQ
jgi:hypothetical protein